MPMYNSLSKLLSLGTMLIQNWNLALSQLAIFFEGRLDTVLDL